MPTASTTPLLIQQIATTMTSIIAPHPDAVATNASTSLFRWVVNHAHDWQDLLGSMLGSFVAVMIPVASYWIKSHYTKKEELKESLRRIEICTSRSLHDVGSTLRQLVDVIRRIEELSAGIESIKDPQAVSLAFINFPITGDIYRDHEAPLLKTKSNYLHNKLIILDSLLKGLNTGMIQVKQDFEKLIEQNRFLVALGKIKPEDQRQIYVDNLRNFTATLCQYRDIAIRDLIKHLFQVNVYNDFLRQAYNPTLQKYEKEIKEDIRADLLEVIDEALKDPVDKKIKDFRARLEYLQQTKPKI